MKATSFPEIVRVPIKDAHREKGTVVISVTGGTFSGKTTIAAMIQQFMAEKFPAADMKFVTGDGDFLTTINRLQTNPDVEKDVAAKLRKIVISDMNGH